jgi:single-strand DNA-binding protein
MANDLNRCEFIGRLGADVDIRYTVQGRAVANFNIAVGRKWKDKQTNENVESTEWIRIVAFNRLAEICSEYLKKGSQIFVSGELKTRKWQDKSGQDHLTTEIVAHEMQMFGGGQRQEAKPHQEPEPPANFDDSIPF